MDHGVIREGMIESGSSTAVVINDKYEIRVIRVRIPKMKTKLEAGIMFKKSYSVLSAQLQAVDSTTSPKQCHQLRKCTQTVSLWEAFQTQTIALCL